MRDKALQPAEQKTVLFYEDEITAVRMANVTILVQDCEALKDILNPEIFRSILHGSGGFHET